MQHFTALKMEHIHPLKGTIMLKKTIKYLFTPRPITKMDIIAAFIEAAIVAAFYGWIEWMLRKELSKMDNPFEEKED